MAKKGWLLLILLLLLCPLRARAEVSYEGLVFTGEEEYIDLGDLVVKDFDAFTGFLQQMPRLKQVDMWKNRMTAAQCDLLASRFPGMKWGWTMVIKNWDHEHLVRTDYTSWSTLHNNKSAKHTSEDFAVLKYCWDLKALDIGHNNVTSLDFLYDLPDLRILIVACNAVEDITPVASLTKLEYAELFNNKITDITPLRDLTHLLDLNLCFNKIQDLTPAAGLTQLQRLWLYSCRKINAAPAGEDLDQVQAALAETWIDTTHYSTNGGWRYTSGDHMHPHYEVILQNFGANHLHPRYEYVPFAESFDAPEAAADLVLLAPQDFTDKGYLLPVDFTPGRTPAASGYTDGHTYSDSTISVTVGEGNTGACAYWFADIRLTDASQIRTLAATLDGSFDTGDQMDAIRLADRANAVLVINGDCWNTREKRGLGYIVRQGILYENCLESADKTHPLLMDVLLIDEEGDFIVLHQPTEGTVPGTVNGKRILNAFSFGPILVKDGRAVEDFHGADRWFDMRWMEPRQRMCLCQTGPLQYKVVCCAGPFKENSGLTIREFADLVAGMGVQTAYNLDGGDSTLLYFNGAKVNEFGYRARSWLKDIIYFASGE